MPKHILSSFVTRLSRAIVTISHLGCVGNTYLGAIPSFGKVGFDGELEGFLAKVGANSFSFAAQAGGRGI